MYAPSFNGCDAKLERAREHRDTLDTYLSDAFTDEGDLPRLSIKYDHRSADHLAYVSHMPDYESKLTRASAILGDVVQNLRNALNLAVFQLALQRRRGTFASDEQERRVQFPIEDKLSRFWARCRPPKGQERRGWIADLRPRDWALIYPFQPCIRGYGYWHARRLFHPLADLRDLTDADKHRSLTKVLISPTRVKDTSGALAPVVMHHMERQPRGGPYKLPFPKLGTVLFRAPATATALTKENVDMVGNLIPEIALSDGRPVMKVVDRMADITIRILGQFYPVA